MTDGFQCGSSVAPFVPDIDDTRTLGQPALRWAGIYTHNISIYTELWLHSAMIRFYDSTAGTDEKRWRVYIDSGASEVMKFSGFA